MLRTWGMHNRRDGNCHKRYASPSPLAWPGGWRADSGWCVKAATTRAAPEGDFVVRLFRQEVLEAEHLQCRCKKGSLLDKELPHPDSLPPA